LQIGLNPTYKRPKKTGFFMQALFILNGLSEANPTFDTCPPEEDSIFDIRYSAVLRFAVPAT
jgi:hypothetical protein